MLSVRPGWKPGAPAGTLLRIAGCIPTFSTRGKGALGPPLSALAGASKRETPKPNVTKSTDCRLQTSLGKCSNSLFPVKCPPQTNWPAVYLGRVRLGAILIPEYLDSILAILLPGAE